MKAVTGDDAGGGDGEALWRVQRGHTLSCPDPEPASLIHPCPGTNPSPRPSAESGSWCAGAVAADGPAAARRPKPRTPTPELDGPERRGCAYCAVSVGAERRWLPPRPRNDTPASSSSPRTRPMLYPVSSRIVRILAPPS